MAERIQLRRAKGWTKPAGAIVVARPSRWGNPFRVGDCYRNPGPYRSPASPHRAAHRESAVGTYTGYDVLGEPFEYRVELVRDRAHAVELFRGYIGFHDDVWDPAGIRSELGGHDLACWCPFDQPCHADVLLRIANEEVHHAE